MATCVWMALASRIASNVSRVNLRRLAGDEPAVASASALASDRVAWISRFRPVTMSFDVMSLLALFMRTVF